VKHPGRELRIDRRLTNLLGERQDLVDRVKGRKAAREFAGFTK
jgi:hypothetical protein